MLKDFLKLVGAVAVLLLCVAGGAWLGYYPGSPPDSPEPVVTVTYQQGLKDGIERMRLFDHNCLMNNWTNEQIDSASKAMAAVYADGYISCADSIATLNAALAPLHDCSTYVEMQIDHRANWFAHDICSGRVRTIDSLKEHIDSLSGSLLGVSYKQLYRDQLEITQHWYGRVAGSIVGDTIFHTLHPDPCADLIAAVDSLTRVVDGLRLRWAVERNDSLFLPTVIHDSLFWNIDTMPTPCLHLPATPCTCSDAAKQHRNQRTF